MSSRRGAPQVHSLAWKYNLPLLMVYGGLRCKSPSAFPGHGQSPPSESCRNRVPVFQTVASKSVRSCGRALPLAALDKIEHEAVHLAMLKIISLNHF